MRFLECQQGEAQWLQLRAGKCTASRFADAVSVTGSLDERQQQYVGLVRAGVPSKDAAAQAGYKAAPTSTTVKRAIEGEDTTRPSETAMRYAADIAIERISGHPHGEPPKAWVLDRGHKMEDLARVQYEVRKGAFVTESGICITDDGLFAYSSDGLVDDDGLIEIKAPTDSSHILRIIQTDDVSDYMHQMQGGMWVTGRKWVDFIMYVPDLESVSKDLYVKRVWRDDKFIDDMVLGLAKFQGVASAYEAVLRAA